MSSYEDYVWSALSSFINNDYGVAGLMGNLKAESGIIPFRLQGDFTSGYTKSIAYTNNVNSGSYSKDEFSHDSKGYGLAQWTSSNRKAGLYDLRNGRSIGDISLGCDYLIQELSSSYSGVLSVLRSATSVRQASDKVLHDFENPREQGEDVEIYRASLGQAYYDHYSDNPPGPIPPPPIPVSSIPIWLLFKMQHN